LEHIRELEEILENVEEKEHKLKKIVKNVEILCQSILDNSMLKKEIKSKIKKYITLLHNNLETKPIVSKFYKNGYLDIKKLFQFFKEIDFSDKIFFIFRLRGSRELQFSASFIETKFTSLVAIDVNRIIGVIPKNRLKEFEKLKTIPCFKDSNYCDLQFFVIFFEMKKFSEGEYHRAVDIFERFFLKNSFSDKHYIHYSLIENRIIDYEAIEKNKLKKEYSYIFEMKYPELDLKLRKEIKNIKFLLILLDRIDNELEEIKKSKGTILVVRRILSFIHKNQLDKDIHRVEFDFDYYNKLKEEGLI